MRKQTHTPEPKSVVLDTPEFVGELPVRERKSSDKYMELFTLLKKRVNKWALIAKHKTNAGASARAYYIRKHREKLLPDGKFEFAVRKNGDGTNLYARYVG